MSYLCLPCGSHVPHGQSLRRHVVYRANGQIEKEFPVCSLCAVALSDGVPMKDLRNFAHLAQRRRTEKVAAEAVTKPVQRLPHGAAQSQEKEKGPIPMCEKCFEPVFDAPAGADGVLCPEHRKRPSRPPVKGKRRPCPRNRRSQ